MRPGSASRTASLRRRRTRLRSTAPPSLRLVVKPTRGGPSSPRFRICTTTLGAALEAPRAVARKSRLCFRRCICLRAPVNHDPVHHAPVHHAPVHHHDRGEPPAQPLAPPPGRSVPARPRASPDRACAAGRSPGARPWWPCGREIRGAAYERACLAEKSASRGDLRLMSWCPQTPPFGSRGSIVPGRAMRGLMACASGRRAYTGQGPEKSTRASALCPARRYGAAHTLADGWAAISPLAPGARDGAP
jgi:hypothetical protein